MVVRAALASAPYLLRRGDLIATRMLLDRALMRDESPGTAQVALPVLRRIADATGTPKDLGILARALRGVDPGETERLMRKALEIAIADGDYRFASGATGDLVNMLIVGGRLAEALQAAGRKPEFTRLAGLGPWIQLADQGQRLQVLGLMGEHERVLAEVESLRATMADLPPRQSSNDPASPWHVREFILDIGRSSAQATKDWERCLELNAEIQAVKQQRHAGEHEVARSLLNDAVPLIRLGRLEEAERLLANCQQVFEDHADSIRVARVLSTRAYLEDARTHWEIAADLERTALRLFYVRPEPLDIATSHHNLANYLGRRDNLGADEQAHRMAAALIRRLSGTAHDLADTVRVLTDELSADSPTVPLPSTVTEVVAVVEQTEGVHLAALLGALEPDPAAVEAVLSEVLTVATADAE